jgi:phage gp29-like protein
MLTPETLNSGRFVAELQQSKPLDETAGHIATRQTAWELTSFFNLLPNPDEVLRKMGVSIKVYNDIKSEAIVKGLVARREGSVKSMERGFDRGTASSRVAKNLKAIFDDLDHAQIIEEGLDGAFKGYAVFEVIWGKVGSLLVPTGVVAKPQQWFGFDPTNRLVYRTRSAPLGEPVPDRKFICIGKKRTYANPYGEADFAACFWPVTFKRGGLKFWVQFTEKYGTPWAIGKQPRNASKADTEQLADQLEQMVQDAVAVVPDDSSVELVTLNTSSNAELYEKLLMFCRGEVSIALLGNNQTVEMQSNKASAASGQEVEHYIRDADAMMLGQLYNQLALWTAQLNFGDVELPKWEFWEQEEVDETLANRDRTLAQAGVTFTPAYWKRTYKLEDGDITERTSPVDGNAPPVGGSTTDFADADMPPDQAALDAAVAKLPKDELQAAMKALIEPALKAIAAAQTPDEVRQALEDAWPDMDAGKLDGLMKRAYFVADLLGRASVKAEAA